MIFAPSPAHIAQLFSNQIITFTERGKINQHWTHHKTAKSAFWCYNTGLLHVFSIIWLATQQRKNLLQSILPCFYPPFHPLIPPHVPFLPLSKPRGSSVLGESLSSARQGHKRGDLGSVPFLPLCHSSLTYLPMPPSKKAKVDCIEAHSPLRLRAWERILFEWLTEVR